MLRSRKRGNADINQEYIAVETKKPQLWIYVPWRKIFFNNILSVYTVHILSKLNTPYTRKEQLNNFCESIKVDELRGIGIHKRRDSEALWICSMAANFLD